MSHLENFQVEATHCVNLVGVFRVINLGLTRLMDVRITQLSTEVNTSRYGCSFD